MSTAERQILTPGETAPAAAPAPAVASAAEGPAAPAPERKKPGPKPRPAAAAAAPADADLDDFDSDELPPAPTSAVAPAGDDDFTPEQQRKITAMIAAAVQASKSAQDPATAAKLAAAANTAARLPSQAEAKAMCDDSVAQGRRPRPIMTPDGWYVHPESVRVVDHGVARLQVG